MSVTTSAVTVDIRSNTILSVGTTSASYTAAIEYCNDIVGVEFIVGDQTQVMDAGDKLFNQNSFNGCLFIMDGFGSNLLNPSIKLIFADNTEQLYSETFVVDSVKPAISFDQVSIKNDNGQQQLITSVQASDDNDIAYLTYSVTGIRASDLRSVGGVVEKAQALAFAKSGGNKRAYPSADNQTHFNFTLNIEDQLSAQAIARDAIVMLTVAVVDASGNQNTLSKIAFTGDSIVENVLSLSVHPQKLIFTNALETAALIPTVDFEFRGPTALPGAGTGVSYSSSHPQIVNVTSQGTVYPLAETATAGNGETGFITVGYP
ncbi:MAG: hypothetical protein MJK04_24970, partial [Psychrosphaera sp.]|nr:hypothetical protein [Psychrosphaera sp.]